MKTIVLSKRGQPSRHLDPEANQVRLIRKGQRIVVALADGWKHLDAMLKCGWRAVRVV